MDESLNLRLASDVALQSWIDHCGRQMLAADALLSGPMTIERMQDIRHERRRWLEMQEAALRERAGRPEMVAALEARQRERMALEPGAAAQ